MFTRKPRIPYWVALFVIGLATACAPQLTSAPTATPAPPAAPQSAASAPTLARAEMTPLSFTFKPVGTSGITGSGTLSPGTTRDESTMLVQWQGFVPGSVHAVSQHHGKSCDDYESQPEFVFDNVTADSQGKAAASIAVKKAFEKWSSKPHFVVVHASADVKSAVLTCGSIVVNPSQ